jgi:hypothetical protein
VRLFFEILPQERVKISEKHRIWGYNEVLSNQKERQKNPFGFITSLEKQFLEVP